MIIKEKKLDIPYARILTEAAIKIAYGSIYDPIAVAVVDESGRLVAFLKSSLKVLPVSDDLAIMKAKTAVMFGDDTSKLANIPMDLAKYCNSPGGIILETPDGEILGGVGISGRWKEGQTSDVDVATKAIAMANSHYD